MGITGGKLTTFRVAARQVLAEVQKQLAHVQLAAESQPLFALQHSGHAPDQAPDGDRLNLGAAEHTVHLDDLMLRRTRSGLVLPDFGAPLLDEAVEAMQHQHRWNSAHARQEVLRYRAHVQAQHRVPEPR